MKYWPLFGFLVLLGLDSFSQNTYNMANQTVSDCDGIFLDSDAGMPTGNYAHNEDLTFTIAVPQATSITMNFSQFCTEFAIDTITFFDGPNTLSPVIFGPHSGSLIPPQIVATSGYLTIHFTSDANLACDGWEATWSTTVPPPTPPQIDSIQATCISNELILYLDTLVHCDSVFASAFSLSGPSSPSISSVQPLNCTNDSTREIRVSLSNTYADCGNFTIDYDLGIADECDSIYSFTVTGGFDIFDCPISSNLVVANDSLCENDCTTVFANGMGGDCSLLYQWSNGLPPNPGPHPVCPTGDTSFYVVVYDGFGNQPDTNYISISMFSYPDAGQDTVWCTSGGLLNLPPGTPAGGAWFGNGIVNPIGTFDPTVAGAGNHKVYYQNVVCSDSLIITVFDLNAGPDQAACPGQTPFQLTGANPPGGVYAGQFTSPTGVFDPQVVGIFPVTYALNGCIDTLLVSVDSIQFNAQDTACLNDANLFIGATPAGGTFSGPGIVDPSTGEFNPQIAGLGTHTIDYSIVGCVDQVTIEVIDIDGGGLEVFCPFAGLITLSAGMPMGGYWTGGGIVDSANGIYDPGFAGGNVNDKAIYHVNGCTDTLIIYVRETLVPADTLLFCVQDPFILLNTANTGRSPGNGAWSGPGVIDPQYPGEFDPGVAGVGFHKLIYDANGCKDSVIMEVEAFPSLTQAGPFCESQGLESLSASPPFGTWSGLGVDGAGNFNPGTAGPGNHWISYTNRSGCEDSIQIQVDPQPQISGANLPTTLCFVNQNINLGITPSGGSLSGPGVVGGRFNPEQAGTGNHTLQYIATNGTCADTQSFSIRVLDTLEMIVYASIDSICPGDSVQIIALSSEGNGGPYGYTWNNGLGNGRVKTVAPQTTTTYTVTSTDSCSNPIQGSVTVNVHPPIQTSTTVGPIICYSDTGYATITGGTNYTYTWGTNPPQVNDTVRARPGTYTVLIQDTVTGCLGTSSVTIPGHPYLNAAFSKNPNRPCVTTATGEITVYDFSTGGSSGYWYFGEGDTIPYFPGDQPTHTYNDTGNYTIELVLFNQFGCESRFSDSICVEPEVLFHLPTAFSPNGDGVNDKYTFFFTGVESLTWRIYDRWGEMIHYQTENPLSWDGTTMNGFPVSAGFYPSRIDYIELGTGRKKKLIFSIFVLR